MQIIILLQIIRHSSTYAYIAHKTELYSLSAYTYVFNKYITKLSIFNLISAMTPILFTCLTWSLVTLKGLHIHDRTHHTLRYVDINHLFIHRRAYMHRIINLNIQLYYYILPQNCHLAAPPTPRALHHRALSAYISKSPRSYL